MRGEHGDTLDRERFATIMSHGPVIDDCNRSLKHVAHVVLGQPRHPRSDQKVVVRPWC